MQTVIVAVDVQDDKLALASQLGATHTVNASANDPVDAIHEITQGAASTIQLSRWERVTMEQPSDLSEKRWSVRACRKPAPRR